MSSEDPEHPIESALVPAGGRGWLAARPGEQTVRILFAEPQTIRQIRLLFVDDEQERTQEFVLRWSSDRGTYREIVRQQYNFSPGGATCELEDYRVDLEGLTALDLTIVPDVRGRPARASVAELRLA
ncbi:MAG TPA: hypothetical protein VNL14_01230 [Candidatus Acidoferrales bacterium]|nr:hypothetical protein [Candidatus Acidoferrales bacterium]